MLPVFTSTTSVRYSSLLAPRTRACNYDGYHGRKWGGGEGAGGGGGYGTQRRDDDLQQGVAMPNFLIRGTLKSGCLQLVGRVDINFSLRRTSLFSPVVCCCFLQQSDVALQGRLSGFKENHCMDREFVSQLVGALSPVNHRGLHEPEEEKNRRESALNKRYGFSYYGKQN